MDEATSGFVEAFGCKLPEDKRQLQQQLGICPQRSILWPELTVYEHCKLFSSFKVREISLVGCREVESASAWINSEVLGREETRSCGARPLIEHGGPSSDPAPHSSVWYAVRAYS